LVVKKGNMPCADEQAALPQVLDGTATGNIIFRIVGNLLGAAAASDRWLLAAPPMPSPANPLAWELPAVGWALALSQMLR
jgi:hypothetical protein